jgi:hypothetical protein
VPQRLTADEFSASVRKLVGQVEHWTPSRWAASSSSSGGSKAVLMHGLVQRLADRSADAEGQPRRPVPRLDNDLALPDQLRVVAADLLRAGGADAESLALVDQVRGVL